MGLAMVAAGGVVQVFIYPYLSGDIKAEKRQAAFAVAGPKRNAENQTDAASRRKQIIDSLKEVEARGKRKRQTLDARIAQAGLSGAANIILSLRLSRSIGRRPDVFLLRPTRS